MARPNGRTGPAGRAPLRSPVGDWSVAPRGLCLGAAFHLPLRLSVLRAFVGGVGRMIPSRRTAPVVLVVDDSAAVRRIVARVLAEDDLRVLTAASGREALRIVGRHPVDLVTLDVEMPGLDGLATLVALRRRHRHLPVLMLSAHTRPASATTLDALGGGATDYVEKPTGATSPEVALEVLRHALLPAIRRLLAAARPGPAHAGARSRAPGSVGAGGRPGPGRPAGFRPAVVAIAASSGGPAALERLFGALPDRLGLPVLVAQHLPASFTPVLARRLARPARRAVRLAVGGEALQADEVLLAPGDGHLRVVSRAGVPVTDVVAAGPTDLWRPSADALFTSLAAVFPGGVLAVVLSGMGRDGLAGSAVVRSGGGVVFAQDMATSAVWGMPGLVVHHGLADAVDHPEGLAARIVSVVGRLRGGTTDETVADRAVPTTLTSLGRWRTGGPGGDVRPSGAESDGLGDSLGGPSERSGGRVRRPAASEPVGGR